MITLSAGIEVERQHLEGAQLEWYAAAARVKRRAELLLAAGWAGVLLFVAGLAFVYRAQATVSWLAFAALLAVILASPTFAFRPRRPLSGTRLSARVRAARAMALRDRAGRVIGYVFEDAGDPARLLYVRDATLASVPDFPSDDFTLEYFVSDDGAERRALDVRGRRLRPIGSRRVDAAEDELPEQFAVLRGPLERLDLADGRV